MRKNELQVQSSPRIPDPNKIRTPEDLHKTVRDTAIAIKQLWRKETLANRRIANLEKKSERHWFHDLEVYNNNNSLILPVRLQQDRDGDTGICMGCKDTLRWALGIDQSQGVFKISPECPLTDDYYFSMNMDGLVRVGGRTSFLQIDNTGDVVFVGSGGLVFGSCYGNHINWLQAGAVQNTWYNISDPDIVTGELNNVTHDGSGELTVTKPGKYKISYSVCFVDDTANDHIEVGIEVNDSGVANAAGLCHVENKFANEEEHVGSCCILDLPNNATIELAIRTTDLGNPDITVHAINLVCVQVGGT